MDLSSCAGLLRLKLYERAFTRLRTNCELETLILRIPRPGPNLWCVSSVLKVRSSPSQERLLSFGRRMTRFWDPVVGFNVRALVERRRCASQARKIPETPVGT